MGPEDGFHLEGSRLNAAVDEAIRYYPAIENFLRQDKQDRTELADCYRLLAQALDMPPPQ